jgi:hypothetical protein
MSGNLNFLTPHTTAVTHPSGHLDPVKDINKPGEGARRGVWRGSGAPHRFDAEVGRVRGIDLDFEAEDEFERDRR